MRTRTIVTIAAAALLVVGLVVGGFWLWGVLADYVNPKTATGRKDLVNVFVLITAGVVGFLTAIAALGNFYISRKNLRQQFDLAERRAQDDALQAYFEQIGKLLTEQDLQQTDEHRRLLSLVRGQTLTLLRRLGAQGKRDVVLFLWQVGLVNKEHTAISILGVADLTGADLHDATLIRTALSRADLSGANLRDARLAHVDLTNADLRSADLRGADLWRADLTDADLSGAAVTKEQLERAKSLKGATMPDGTKHP